VVMGSLKILVPLGEDQVRGDHDGFLFVALGEEVEEDFHLFADCWTYPMSIDDNGVEALKPGDRLWQLQVAFAASSWGDQAEGRNEEHLELMAADPFSAMAATTWVFAPSGQTEAEQIVPTTHEVGFQQSRDLPADFSGRIF